MNNLKTVKLKVNGLLGKIEKGTVVENAERLTSGVWKLTVDGVVDYVMAYADEVEVMN